MLAGWFWQTLLREGQNIQARGNLLRMAGENSICQKFTFCGGIHKVVVHAVHSQNQVVRFFMIIHRFLIFLFLLRKLSHARSLVEVKFGGELLLIIVNAALRLLILKDRADIISCLPLGLYLPYLN